MFIDGKQILSNPGLHGPIEKCVTVEVTKVAALSLKQPLNALLSKWNDMHLYITCLFDCRGCIQLLLMFLRRGAEYTLWPHTG
jgi:hypothetical protein